MSKTEALKRFFTTPNRPVTTQELMALRKGDPAGFDELGLAALAALEEKGGAA